MTQVGVGKGDDVGEKRPDPLSIAKWLIPSASILFLVIGYVSQTAQDSLLGLAETSSDPHRYFYSAAAFFTTLATEFANVVTAPFSGAGPTVGEDRHWLMWATLAVAFIVLLPYLILRCQWLLARIVKRLRRKPEAGASLERPKEIATQPTADVLLATRMQGVLLPLAMIALVALKFVFLDTPLAQVSNFIEAVSKPSGNAKALGDQLGSGSTGSFRDWKSLQSRIDNRKKGLWESIICSREKGSGTPGSNAFCRKSASREANQRRLEGDFAAQMWAVLLIVALATGILLNRPNGALAGVSLVALAYCLTLPFAYGKLLKPTMFPFGQLRMADALVSAGGLQPPPHSATSTPSAKPSNRALGLLLYHDGGTLTLLIAKQAACGIGEGTYKRTYLTNVSDSQILSVEQIYSEDLIEWAIRSQEYCPF